WHSLTMARCAAARRAAATTACMENGSRSSASRSLTSRRSGRAASCSSSLRELERKDVERAAERNVAEHRCDLCAAPKRRDAAVAALHRNVLLAVHAIGYCLSDEAGARVEGPENATGLGV